MVVRVMTSLPELTNSFDRVYMAGFSGTSKVCGKPVSKGEAVAIPTFTHIGGGNLPTRAIVLGSVHDLVILVNNFENLFIKTKGECPPP